MLNVPKSQHDHQLIHVEDMETQKQHSCITSKGRIGLLFCFNMSCFAASLPNFFSPVRIVEQQRYF